MRLQEQRHLSVTRGDRDNSVTFRTFAERVDQLLERAVCPKTDISVAIVAISDKFVLSGSRATFVDLVLESQHPEPQTRGRTRRGSVEIFARHCAGENRSTPTARGEHSDCDCVEFGHQLEEPRDGSIRVIERLIGKTLRLPLHGEGSIPWMNIPCLPFHFQLSGNVAQAQRIAAQSSARG